MDLARGPVIYATGTSRGPGLWFFAFLVGLCAIGVLTMVLTMPVELPQTAAFVGSAVGLISSIGNLGSFLMPTIMGQIRDVTGSFLLSVLMLGELILVVGLLLKETGWKKIQQLSSSPLFSFLLRGDYDLLEVRCR